MRKYREFVADYPSEDEFSDDKYDSQLTTIDLYSILSFNPGDDNIHTTIRMTDGTMFDLLIPYGKFKKIMKAEVPELFLSKN